MISVILWSGSYTITSYFDFLRSNSNLIFLSIGENKEQTGAEGQESSEAPTGRFRERREVPEDVK